jgi:Trypsin
MLMLSRDGERPPRASRTCTWGLLLFCLWLSCFAVACSVEDGSVAQQTQAIVYGRDDRKELFEVEDATLRSRVERSVVAITTRDQVDVSDDAITLLTPSWQEQAMLCEGEPFAAQPAAAFCSGVLIDWDLVLTAGHCLRAFALADLVVLFGYSYSAPGRLSLRPEDAVEVSEIVAEACSKHRRRRQSRGRFSRRRRSYQSRRGRAPRLGGQV